MKGRARAGARGRQLVARLLELLEAPTGDGIVANPGVGASILVRWLHLRGLVNSEDGSGVEWGQLHIAVPVEHRVDVAADLAAP